jgi:hypothetical protein
VYYGDVVDHAIHRLDKRDGTDRVLAAAAGDPWFVVAGGDFVYWNAGDHVERVGKRGDARATVLASYPRYMVADDRALYVEVERPDEIVRIDHGQTAAVVIDRDVFYLVHDFAVAGDHVYFAGYGELYRVPTAGGARERVATGGVNPRFASLRGDLYWTTSADYQSPSCPHAWPRATRRVEDRTGRIEAFAWGCDLRTVAPGDRATFLVDYNRLARAE